MDKSLSIEEFLIGKVFFDGLYGEITGILPSSRFTIKYQGPHNFNYSLQYIISTLKSNNFIGIKGKELNKQLLGELTELFPEYII